MSYSDLYYEGIDETLFAYEHSSGLKVFVDRKKGFNKKHACFATKYGSINNRFIIPGENKETRVPDGIAHFLEHKLFEEEYGDVMDKFSILGSQPNAYTSFTKTAYNFTCTDKFSENFELLLNFVQNPYLTDESVEKEKGIIEQEINMYKDNPDWRVYFNLLEAFYHNHPAKLDIAGSVESIQKIDKEILMKCYNTFYHPSNMVIAVAGDVNPDEIFTIVDKLIKKSEKKGEVIHLFDDEPNEVNKEAVVQELSVSIPMFYMGVKDMSKMNNEKEYLMKKAVMDIILEYVFGRSSDLFDNLYGKGLIDNSFSFDFEIEESYSFSLWGGRSKSPDKTTEIIAHTIEEIIKNGISIDDFDRIKKSKKGDFLKAFNSVNSIVNGLISNYFIGVDYFKKINAYNDISIDFVNNIIKEHFTNNMAISVVNPAH